jgi:Phage integrase family
LERPSNPRFPPPPGARHADFGREGHLCGGREPSSQCLHGGGRDRCQPGRRWFRTRVWAKALARADLGFHVTPHGLRHAHASWLLAGGADLQVVKERLGHGSVTTTQTYLHTLPNADTVALAALDAVRGRRDGLLTEQDQPTQQPADGAIDPPHDELARMRQMLTEMKHLLERGPGSA